MSKYRATNGRKQDPEILLPKHQYITLPKIQLIGLKRFAIVDDPTRVPSCTAQVSNAKVMYRGKPPIDLFRMSEQVGTRQHHHRHLGNVGLIEKAIDSPACPLKQQSTCSRRSTRRITKVLACAFGHAGRWCNMQHIK